MNIQLNDAEILKKSQERIWEMHIEMSGYSALFRNLGTSDFSPEEFYGLSLMLQRYSKRLQKISELMSKTE